MSENTARGFLLRHRFITKVTLILVYLLASHSSIANAINLPQDQVFNLQENFQLLKLDKETDFSRRGFLFSLDETTNASVVETAQSKSQNVFTSYLAVDHNAQTITNSKGLLQIKVFSSKEYNHPDNTPWTISNLLRNTHSDCDKQCNKSSIAVASNDIAFDQELSDQTLYDINFFSPLISRGHSSCQINNLTKNAFCEFVSSVVMVFTPYNSEIPPTTIIHTVNHDRLEQIYLIKSETELFLRDITKMKKTAKDFLAFRFAQIDNVIAQERPNLPSLFYFIVRYYISLIKENGFFGESYNPTPVFNKLPEEPIPAEELLVASRAIKSLEDRKWVSGTASGSVYSGNRQSYKVQNEMHANHAHGNAIQRDLFPSGMYYEGNIVSSVLDILAADQINNEEREPDAVVTSGGTMSIKSALSAHYNLAKANHIENPEMILPVTAHPAHLRSDDSFVVRFAPVNDSGNSPSYTVDLEAVEKLINKNTVLLVGSAVNYPYGTMDSIEKLSELAEKYNKLENRVHNKIRVHVDACLGGFFLAFLDRKKHGFGEFDFRVPNVHSITIDTHKYGGALKGSSVVAFRTRDVADHASFVATEWLGGMLASANEEGSKSAGDYAAAWASMALMGKSGYRQRAEALYQRAKEFADKVWKTRGLEVMGKHSMCLAFKSRIHHDSGEPVLNMGHIKDYLGSAVEKPRWRFNGLQYPDGLHFCVTGPQLPENNPDIVERFGTDLKKAAEQAEWLTITGVPPKGGNVYGASSVNISFKHPECKVAFIKAAGYLTRTVDDMEKQLEDFQFDMLSILNKNLGIRPSFDLLECPNE
ncbi:hypothetical protein EOPP23_11230 [Endozoicomonas sp. OPT23]|uniref:pyridoxal-dependent decarboxylase n=1 Tax=Endozoicomonas sp. OPT23 TaxID=2072845 RepID=UPI00129AF10D|nr:pyridoxal-dependent decarboxylase [Endozoicomonas sp. OPT23]MRI33558.1 hypothetical protein [Endozoicomonas sp. OPT23]